MDLTHARALTLLQPWGHAVAHCGKNVENRTWAAKATPFPILIHNGKGVDLHALSFIEGLGHTVPDRPSPSGIIAVATVTGICSGTANFDRATCSCGPWSAPGQHHWRLADVVALAEIVPCRGALGLWRPGPDVLAAVAGQMF